MKETTMSKWNINWQGKLYPVKWYSPEDGCIGHCSFDSETTLIVPGQVANFVIGSAYNGKTVYYIKKQDMRAFMDNHKDKMVFMANAPFDLYVLEKIKAIDDVFEEAELNYKTFHVIDLLLLENLLNIGKYGKEISPSLDMLAQQYKEQKLPKDIQTKVDASVYQGVPELDWEKYEDSVGGQEKFIEDLKNALHKVYKEILWSAPPRLKEDSDDYSLKVLLWNVENYLNVKISVSSVKYTKKTTPSEELKGTTYYSKLFRLISDALEEFKKAPYRNVRTSYGNFYREDGTINYEAMEQDAYWYAGIDVIATYEIAERQLFAVKKFCEEKNVPYEKLLSHHDQLLAHLALDKVSRNGFCIDHDKMKEIKKDLTSRIDTALQILEKYNWRPGNGSKERMNELIGEHKLKIPKTPKSGDYQTSEDNLLPFDNIEWVRAYLDYVSYNKLMSYVNLKGERVHTRFKPVVATGRTSSSGPNIQNFPRNFNMRGVLKASPGNGLIMVDYGQEELAVLSYITHKKFGFSKMRDLINEGRDLHRYYVSKFLKKAEEDVTKDERQGGKAVNFGYPGGLGPAKLVVMAKKNYSVTKTVDEAKKEKQAWLKIFPEMDKYLKESSTLKEMLDSGILDSFEETIGWGNPEVAFWILKGILSGQVSTKGGRDYSQKEIDWAFDLAEKIDFPNKKNVWKSGKISKWGLVNNIKRKEGSFDLWSNFSSAFTTVIYDCGRVRGWLKYTDSKNSPFQGVASDVSKRALVKVVRGEKKHGYRVINFIHDEIIVEASLDRDFNELSKIISDYMVEAFNELCPGVVIKTESEFAINWSKTGTHIPDKKGRLVPIPQKEEKKVA